VERREASRQNRRRMLDGASILVCAFSALRSLSLLRERNRHRDANSRGYPQREGSSLAV
jgi:hypothetical protein